ncbi:MAG: hypothetical protein EOP11_00530 [Proteobacteria bacterium]|nr:MAG: hypothetical protein EOP11_00530 [Pseudomonadota bacterium]
MLKTTLILASLLVPGLAQAAVWPTTRRWDANAENQYKTWVQTSWKVDIFQNKQSLYYGLFPDCADTVYAMRAIFASQNGLPFAVVDPSTNRSTITNEMQKFDKVAAGPKRVTAYLNWLFGVLGTVTLPADTYPVAINRDAVHAGGLMLAKESKHSYTVKDIRQTGVPVLVYSTQANRGDLKVRSWPSVGYLFSKGIKQPSGFRYFRYPEHLLKPVWEVPGFSDEQYQAPANKWVAAMQAKLANRKEVANEALTRQVDDACQLITTRVELVNEAMAQLKKIGDRCMNAQEYDDYSTPSRDGQTKAAFEDLAATLKRALKNNEAIDATLREQLQNVFADNASDEKGAQICAITYAKGKTISLGELRRRLFTGMLSSNPNDPLSVRWGEVKGPSDRAKRCPIY